MRTLYRKFYHDDECHCGCGRGFYTQVYFEYMVDVNVAQINIYHSSSFRIINEKKHPKFPVTTTYLISNIEKLKDLLNKSSPHYSTSFKEFVLQHSKKIFNLINFV